MYRIKFWIQIQIDFGFGFGYGCHPRPIPIFFWVVEILKSTLCVEWSFLFYVALISNDLINYLSLKLKKRLQVKIISLTNGERLNEFSLNSYHDHFFVDALSRTIVIDDIFSNLKIYEKPSNTSKHQAAQLILEKQLDLGNSHGLRVTMDGKLYFVKNKKTIQHYSFCN